MSQLQRFVFQFFFPLFFELKVLFYLRQCADVGEHVFGPIMPRIRVGSGNFGEGFFVQNGRVEVEILDDFTRFVFALVVDGIGSGEIDQGIFYVSHHVILHQGRHVFEQRDVLFAHFFVPAFNQTIHQKSVG